MFDEMEEASTSGAIVAFTTSDPEWQPILHASNQVVLYNPTSHALSIRKHSPPPRSASVVRRTHTGALCPYCHRRLPGQAKEDGVFDNEALSDFSEDEIEDNLSSRVSNYFQLLQVANESASVPPSPRSSSPTEPPSGSSAGTGSGAFRAANMAEGYFKAFFQEECRLGMGANGSVFLCQHMLDGNSLGHFAVKKIAVGQSHSYLFNTLREVRLLEKLHHPNIITYHHAWLETCQFSSFGPKVPTLHVLMQWAEGGSLDDFIDARLGRSTAPHIAHVHPPTGSAFPLTLGNESDSSHTPTELPAQSTSTPLSRSARIRAFRALQRAPPEERERLRREMAMSTAAGQHGGASTTSRDVDGTWVAVHLLSAEEVKSLFTDVVEGLAFLHDMSILHLDLKPGNVLLTWDEGKLIPRAMLSDFGTSQDMLNSRARSGNTGTLEYTSPESLPSPSTGKLSQIDSKSDMWSLGMILHKLLFFRLPYQHASDNVDQDSRRDGKEIADLLEREVLGYPGFKSTPALTTAFESRRLPRAYLILLEGLLNRTPSARPSSERVLGAIREGRLDPIVQRSKRSSKNSLIPIARRGSNTSTSTIRPSTSQRQEIDVDTHGSGAAREDSNEPLLPLATATEKSRERRDPSEFPALLPPDGGDQEPEHTLRLGVKKVLISRMILKRTIKSMLLVGKVVTLSTMCGDSNFHLAVRGFAIILAIMDTWFDGFQISLVLGLIHLVLLRFAC